MNSELREEYASVRSELYQLLLTAYCYDQKFNRLKESISEISRQQLLEELMALRHLSNGVISHLCNLDDKSSLWSLRAMHKKATRSPIEQEKILAANKAMKKFRESLNHWKVDHRNSHIAHRNSANYPDIWEVPVYLDDLLPIIKLALITFEKVWGEKVGFGFYLGKHEQFISFPDELGLVT